MTQSLDSIAPALETAARLKQNDDRVKAFLSIGLRSVFFEITSQTSPADRLRTGPRSALLRTPFAYERILCRR